MHPLGGNLTRMCHLRYAFEPNAAHTHKHQFKPIVALSGARYAFSQAATFTGAQYCVIFVVTINASDNDTFKKSYLDSNPSLFNRTLLKNTYRAESNQEYHYYFGFRGLQTVYFALRRYAKEFAADKPHYPAFFQTLETLQQTLSIALANRLQPGVMRRRMLLRTTEPDITECKTDKRTQRYPIVGLAGSDSTFVFKRLTHGAIGSRLVEIEAYSSWLLRFITADAGPVVLPVYNNLHQRMGVISEKFSEFTPLIDIVSPLQNADSAPTDEQLSKTQTVLKAHHQAVTATAVACYCIGDSDWHLRQSGLTPGPAHLLRFVKIDTAEVEPHTAKYRGFPLNQARNIDEHCLPPPASSYPVTADDIQHFPRLPDTHFYHWIDNRRTSAIDLIQLSCAAGKTFADRHFYFLIKAALPPTTSARMAKCFFTSHRARTLYLTHLNDRFDSITKLNLRDASFARWCLNHHTSIKTRAHQHLQTYHNALTAFIKANSATPASAIVEQMRLTNDEQKQYLARCEFIVQGYRVCETYRRLQTTLGNAATHRHRTLPSIPNINAETYIDELLMLVSVIHQQLQPLKRCTDARRFMPAREEFLQLINDTRKYIRYGKNSYFDNINIDTAGVETRLETMLSTLNGLQLPQQTVAPTPRATTYSQEHPSTGAFTDTTQWMFYAALLRHSPYIDTQYTGLFTGSGNPSTKGHSTFTPQPCPAQHSGQP